MAIDMENKEKYYSKQEIMETYNISLSTIDKCMRSGELGYVKVGKRTVRFLQSDLNKWIRHNPSK